MTLALLSQTSILAHAINLPYLTVIVPHINMHKDYYYIHIMILYLLMPIHSQISLMD